MPETKVLAKGEIQLFVDHARTGIVRWGEKTMGGLEGKTVYVRFLLRYAGLYGFRACE